MSKVYNFSAGPAMLPEAVMQRAQKEFVNFNNMGVSVIEMSHRSKEYMAVAEEAVQDLRDLLALPDNYKVLFMHGGGRGMFANVPMNLADPKGVADYLLLGAWSGYAATEAKKYTNVNEIKIDSLDADGKVILDYNKIKISDDAKYVHVCLNETIHGIEVFKDLDTGDKPLIADASSCILSREIDITKYGIIYAGAQKNIGPSGFAIVIIREDLIGHAAPFTPAISDFKVTLEHDSMFNTPNTFAWYLSGLVFKWLKEIGGVKAIEEKNIAKANYLYDYIDSSDFYSNNVATEFRSRMNVPFFLNNKELEAEFLAQAKEANLSGLKGHRVLGGMRASIYNAMPIEGVKALVEFMDKFAKAHK
ncbi:MAG: 3-phosphoserine/phosphohydroxythreonine transaminase [Succinivibrionaceae bacterium]